VALKLQFAGDARVTLVTDHYEPENWPDTIEVVSVGRPLDNWALTRATRTRERAGDGRETEKVFVTLASFAAAVHASAHASTHATTLRVVAAGKELARQVESIEPGKRAHFAFALPEGTGPVEVRIDADGLALDDAVLLAPPPDRTLALFSTLDGDELRALGLAAPGEPGAARWLALVPRSVAVDSPAAAHLVIGHAAVDAPAAWTLVLERLGSERRDLVGPFLADRASALLDGTTLEGSVWSVDPALDLSGTPLVSAGNEPILTEERILAGGGERVTWHLDLDPARSSLQRSPDWPILLANMAELRRAALPGPERTNLGVGERFVDRPGNELAGADREGSPCSMRSRAARHAGERAAGDPRAGGGRRRRTRAARPVPPLLRREARRRVRGRLHRRGRVRPARREPGPAAGRAGVREPRVGALLERARARRRRARARAPRLVRARALRRPECLRPWASSIPSCSSSRSPRRSCGGAGAAASPGRASCAR
jgi:hypothetical protein